MTKDELSLAPMAPGTYVVAVSGGVDSMVLLDLLRQQSQLNLVVAHVNHGIRNDASADQQLVATFCKSHNIIFVSQELYLGAGASEEQARKARYSFLQKCRIKYNANAIVTAHHQDDVIETALINILRGTGWRGLAPFSTLNYVLRPLADVAKVKLLSYAQNHNVPWRNDSTNQDQRYLRNYVRLTVMPWLLKTQPGWREDFLQLIRNQQTLRRKIEDELSACVTYLTEPQNTSVVGKRYDFIMLPEGVAYELLQSLYRSQLGKSLVRQLANASLLFIKTALPGKVMVLDQQWQLRVTRHHLIVEPRPSMVN